MCISHWATNIMKVVQMYKEVQDWLTIFSQVVGWGTTDKVSTLGLTLSVQALEFTTVFHATLNQETNESETEGWRIYYGKQKVFEKAEESEARAKESTLSARALLSRWSWRLELLCTEASLSFTLPSRQQAEGVSSTPWGIELLSQLN